MNIIYEIIIIDDGSSDDSWSEIKKITKKDNKTSAIRFARNFGKSQALHAGFRISNGNIIITLDADLQDSPNEIPNLYNRIISEKLDIGRGTKMVLTLKENMKDYTNPQFIQSLIKKHSEFISSYKFNCNKISKLKIVYIKYFKSFENGKKLNIKILGEKKKSVYVIEKSKKLINVKNHF